jgi:diguanylate cyclase (GGDEF)-like protein
MAGTATARDLMSALDEADFGVIVLDRHHQATFINQTAHRMWALPRLANDATYNFTEILEHERRSGLHVKAPLPVETYLRQRKGRLRRRDGRVLKFECKALPDGGRMMTFIDISDFVRAAEQLKSLAAIDDLTGLPNRRQFFQGLEHQFKRAEQNDRPLSLLMMDADNFKVVNDRHGHFVGDDALRALARRLSGTIRRTDLLGRLGGEEFAVALVGSDRMEAFETAERIRQQVADEPFQVENNKIWMTVSIGVATRQPRDNTPAAELLRLADDALYSAKHDGRNRVLASVH